MEAHPGRRRPRKVAQLSRASLPLDPPPAPPASPEAPTEASSVVEVHTRVAAGALAAAEEEKETHSLAPRLSRRTGMRRMALAAKKQKEMRSPEASSPVRTARRVHARPGSTRSSRAIASTRFVDGLEARGLPELTCLDVLDRCGRCASRSVRLPSARARSTTPQSLNTLPPRAPSSEPARRCAQRTKGRSERPSTMSTSGSWSVRPRSPRNLRPACSRRSLQQVPGTTNRIEHAKAVKMYHRPAAGNEQYLPSDFRTPDTLLVRSHRACAFGAAVR